MIFVMNNPYFCNMKTHSNTQNPLVSNSQKIKEEGIVVLRNITGFPSGDDLFVTSNYVICICHHGRVDVLNEDLPDVDSPWHFTIVYPNRKMNCDHCSKDLQLTMIAVDAKLIDDPLLQIIKQFQYRYESHPSVELGEHEYRMLMKIVDLMQETANIDIPDKKTLLVIQLKYLLRMLGYYRQRVLKDTKPGDQLSNSFYNAVEKHFREHRDVGFYATQACLSTKYFSSVILQETGHPAAYWIHRKVIDEAQMLLHMRPDLSVQAIADQLGFNTQQTFSRYFRRETGLTPTEFRNNSQPINMNQRIAIPSNEGILWQHFGKAPQVTIFNVEDGKIIDSKVLQAPEHEHGAMPRFLAEQGCTDVLCGGLGMGAVNMLNQLGIRIHAGAPELPVEQVMSMFLNGTIVYGDPSCHHHCEGHHHA